MLRLLLFCSLLLLVHCTCPKGFDLIHDGECRGNYTKINTFGDQMANDVIAKCKEIDGLPIIIHNEEHQSYWKEHVGGNGAWTPIGLLCNSNSKKWEWADGSVLDFKPPSGQYYSGLDQSCVTGVSWAISNDGYWNIFSSHNSYTIDVFCTIQLSQPIPNADNCASFEDDSDDGICYQIGATAESWQDAQMICRSIGSDLASVHNSQENAFIRRLAVSKGAVNGVFLGGIISGKGSDFGWIDGTKWDYQNFYPGFPKTGLGDCLAMDSSTSTGQWMNRDCSTKLPVACTRAKNLYSVPICSTDTLNEDQVITSPGYPYYATVPCEFFLIVDEGKKVKLEIISLEANSCCDYLTIYDDYLGGNVIANLTGAVTNATFSTNNHVMRVSWQPNGAVNVRGVVMVFRGV